MLLTLPIPWLFAAVIAAFVHELFHIAAVFLCGGKILDFQLGLQGAILNSSKLSVPRSIICIFAGPFGSFLLILTAQEFPRLALCGFFQGIYNLLPVGTLDGARILHCIIKEGKGSAAMLHWIEGITLFLIGNLALIAAFVLKLGIFPLLVFLILLLQKNTLQTMKTRSTIVLPWMKR